MDGQHNGDSLSALMAEAIDEIIEKERYKVTCEAEVWSDQASIFCDSEIEKLFFVGYRAYKEISARRWCSNYRLDIVPPANRRADIERQTQREPLIISFDEVVRDPSYLASQFKRFLDSTDGQLTELDFLWPQVPVGPYCADFALCRAKMDWIDEKCNDVQYIDAVAVSVPVIIECDGHDFHERTKEQAEHDRQRDRYMQAHDFRIMRFTGRELFRDPMKCAREVDDFLASAKSVAKQQYLCLM
jgi:very-short-patch-repair endonuclease